MTPERFNALAAEGYTRIPVTLELLADLDTPLSTYLKMADSTNSFLLESVQGGERWGRYSMIGLPTATRFKAYGQRIVVEHLGKVIREEQVADPLAEVERFIAQYRVPTILGLPRFQGGVVGYFGYDTLRYTEPKLAKKTCFEDTMKLPDIFLLVTEQMLIFDNLSGKIHCIVFADPKEPNAYVSAQRQLILMRARLRQSYQGPIGQPILQSRILAEEDFTSNFSQAAFEEAVTKIKEYILSGDVMQVVLSQSMSVPFYSEPLNLYRALRTLNPSPYMYYFNFSECQIVGSSPEILVRVEDREICVRPIAGTRYRGRTQAEDEALTQELLNDTKERAEHLMLVDLGRNDLGRVTEAGTVKVTDQMAIERYSHVIHMVSNVTGRLRQDCSSLDVFRATHPAGTLSGAPKVRAMELIDELEPTKRGIYGGAVGYVGWNGNMDLAIAIRTAVIKNQHLTIQAGAGIVADSIPGQEWQETLNKGRAIFKAVAMAEEGLDN